MVTQVIAHRGASHAEPENTLAAFLRAVEMGADAIELDVRCTGDGTLIVHHDAVTPQGQIIACTARRDLDAEIPELGDALVACAGVAVNVEIKPPELAPRSGPANPAVGGGADVVGGAVGAYGLEYVVDETISVLEGFGGGPRWMVSSFSREAVARVGRHHLAMRTALLCDTVDVEDIDAAAEQGCWGINPGDSAVTAAFVRAAHLAGLAVNVWTVDDPRRLEELMGWGVDGIFTNVPDLALRVRERRV